MHQAPEVVGPEVRRGAERLEPGGVLVLENTRWERGETENDPELGRASWRRWRTPTSTTPSARPTAPTPPPRGWRSLLPVGGRAAARARGDRRCAAIVEAPERPLVVVLGGAKVTDKIALIDRFLDSADALLIGGAMCFSFFRAQGIPTGDSLVEEEGVELAREALDEGRGLGLPAAAAAATW